MSEEHDSAYVEKVIEELRESDRPLEQSLVKLYDCLTDCRYEIKTKDKEKAE